MQAPQNSHPDSSSDVPWDVPTRATPDRLVNVSAVSKRTSSQTLHAACADDAEVVVTVVERVIRVDGQIATVVVERGPQVEFEHGGPCL